MFSDNVHALRKQISRYLMNKKEGLKEIIAKAEAMETLSLEDLAALIKVKDPGLREQILSISKEITRKKKGNDIGLIAPLYINNHCNNKCKYCGMSKNNTQLKRRSIESSEKFSDEIQLLRDYGYYTVELVSGGCKLEIEQIVEYVTIMEKFLIENIAFFFDTLSPREYNILCNKKEEVTMVHWQETYLSEEYLKYHPKETPKGDYIKRLNAIETAIENGLTKYAIGILFGLADPKQDLLMCIGHGRYLKDQYSLDPRAVGIVRLQPSIGAEVIAMPFPVDEKDHLFYSAILRLAFPNAEMIATTRESSNHIKNLLKFAATFTNATCTTIPGGYSLEIRKGIQRDGQFYHDSPTYFEVKKMVESLGLKLNPLRPL